MKLEYYFKYYIQGSDHYLIPKDVFIELFDEMENWREEVKELKKQLEENKDKGLYNTCLPYSTGYNKAIKDKETQQKEFIKYLEDEFTKIQNDIEKEIDNNVKYFKVEKRQAIAKILQKYKEIIGDDK